MHNYWTVSVEGVGSFDDISDTGSYSSIVLLGFAVNHLMIDRLTKGMSSNYYWEIVVTWEDSVICALHQWINHQMGHQKYEKNNSQKIQDA
jgi:hypothetical protein